MSSSGAEKLESHPASTQVKPPERLGRGLLIITYEDWQSQLLSRRPMKMDIH
jgi:hypothetical protein